MKKIIAGISVFTLLAFAFPVQSAGTADVTATVTAELISVSVDDGSVAYGALPLNTSEDTVTLTDTQTATNDGNVNVDLGVRSSDAASAGTPWNLAASAGVDAFTHEFSTNSGSTWTDFNADNATYSSIATGVASTGTQDFDLQVGTPTSSTDTVEHTITVTVQATAS